MNYELAKKLKDVGFPQGIGGGGVICENGYYDSEYHEALIPFAYVPTLSEFIKACGDIKLTNLLPGQKWHACKSLEEDCLIRDKIFGGGKTPEEAVANLWLELNK